MPAPTPNTWDSPAGGLAWDTPAGATWDSFITPPKKKKQPFHRQAKSTDPEPPAPFILMSTYKYNVAPLASGGFSARAVRSTPAPQSVFTDHIAAAAGITPAQVELAIPAFFAKLAECAGGCAWSPELYGCVGFTPTSGGNEPSPADFHTPDDINADISISLSAAVLSAVERPCSAVWSPSSDSLSLPSLSLSLTVRSRTLAASTERRARYTPSLSSKSRSSSDTLSEERRLWSSSWELRDSTINTSASERSLGR